MPEQPPSLVLEELDVKARVLRVCVEKLLEQSLERRTYRTSRCAAWSHTRVPRGVCAICGSGDTPGHICIR